MSRDPLPLLQRYAYVGNNPTVFVDPTGEFGCKICHKAARAVGKAVGHAWDIGQWAVDQVLSEWNQAQYVQWVGYSVLITCETVAGCAGGASLGAWAWNQKIKLICRDIGEGKPSHKEGSVKFLISLVTTPPAFGPSLPPGAGHVADYLLNLAIDRAYFAPLSDC